MSIKSNISELYYLLRLIFNKRFRKLYKEITNSLDVAIILNTRIKNLEGNLELGKSAISGKKIQLFIVRKELTDTIQVKVGSFLRVVFGNMTAAEKDDIIK